MISLSGISVARIMTSISFEKSDSLDVNYFHGLLTVTLVPLLSPSGSWLSADL